MFDLVAVRLGACVNRFGSGVLRVSTYVPHGGGVKTRERAKEEGSPTALVTVTAAAGVQGILQSVDGAFEGRGLVLGSVRSVDKER